MSSEAFADLLIQTLEESKLEPGEERHPEMSEEELDEWLKLFGGKKN